LRFFMAPYYKGRVRFENPFLLPPGKESGRTVTRPKFSRRSFIAALVFVTLLLFACRPVAATGPSLTIGAGPDPGRQLLAELAAQLLAGQGLTTVVHHGIPDADLGLRLADGTIDLCFTETAPPPRLPADDAELVRLPALPFATGQALLMRQRQAQALGIQTISDLATLLTEQPRLPLRFAAADSRHLAQIAHHYGLQPALAGQSLPTIDLIYRQLKNGHVDVGIGRASDGRIIAFRLAILTDDKLALAAGHTAPLARADTLRQHPEIATQLARLNKMMDLNTLQRLTAGILIGHRQPGDMAREWLETSARR